MHCDDVDRYRAGLLPQTCGSSSEDVRSHISSCPRCQQMEQMLNSSNVALAVPAEVQRRLEAAILSDLRPVTPIASAFRTAIELLLIAVGAIAAATWRLGTAGFEALSHDEFLAWFALLGASMVVIASMLSRQIVPGAKPHGPPGAVAIAILSSVALLSVAMFPYEWSPRFFSMGAKCWSVGTLCAAGSAPLFWLVLRRGLALSRVWHGATAGLLAGLVGVSVLELHCPYLDSAHVAIWHGGTALTAMLLGAAIARYAQRRSIARA